MDEERSLIVIDNVANGFDIYGLEQSAKGSKFKFVRTLEVGKPSKTYAKSVVFANGSQAVIAGSDHGIVYIFDRQSGRVLKKIHPFEKRGVETISVSQWPLVPTFLNILLIPSRQVHDEAMDPF